MIRRLSWPNLNFPFAAPRRANLPTVLRGVRNDRIADVVERALEAYEIREAGREPASFSMRWLSENYGTDVDLEAVIREARRVHSGPDL